MSVQINKLATPLQSPGVEIILISERALLCIVKSIFIFVMLIVRWREGLPIAIQLVTAFNVYVH